MIPAGCESECRACAHRGWDADVSESQKNDFLKERLKILKCETTVLPTQGLRSSGRWGYRNKVCLKANWELSHGWEFGLNIKKARELRFIAIPNCPVHSKKVRQVVSQIKCVLNGEKYTQHEFPLMFLSLSGDLVTFVLKSKRNEEYIRKVARLAAEVGIQNNLKGVYVNFNLSAGRRVYANRGWEHIWGERFAEANSFYYGPESFQQVLSELHKSAIDEVLNFFMPGVGDSIIDLYSGAGSTLRLWKNTGARCMGVEMVGEAVRCCDLNVGPGLCLRGRASDRIPQMKEWLNAENSNRVLMYVNPPRTGLDTETTRWISHECCPARLAYLSCSPGTLARDLSVLSESGYALRRIIPYDFFPQTHHLEALALLELDSSSDLHSALDPGLASGSNRR